MSSFLSAVEAEMPKFSMLISLFSRNTSSISAFFDIFIPIVSIVETLVRMTFRHQGELPNETYLTEFCESLLTTFRGIGSSALLYSISIRIDVFVKGLQRLIFIADESVTSRFNIGKKSMLLDSLSNCSTIASENIKVGEESCACEGGTRACHKCHLIER
jgi:hypothetical protein